jgi:YfiH family protein
MTWTLVSHPTVNYVQAESPARFPFARQGITTRGEPAKEFNLSFTVAEDWEAVRKNRRVACELFGFEIDELIVPAQVHGAGVAVVGAEHRGAGALSPKTAIPNCDALVTNMPRVLLGITVADCLPVFFLDPIHHAIGLAHSGWRGTAGQIAPNTLEAMRENFGTEPETCVIVIGPGIGADGYEVDAKVHDAFDSETTAAPGVFSPTRPDHWSLDLTTAVVHQLRACGVPEASISTSPWRTHRDTDLFFSHRLVPGCPRMGAFLGLA